MSEHSQLFTPTVVSGRILPHRVVEPQGIVIGERLQCLAANIDPDVMPRYHKNG